MNIWERNGGYPADSEENELQAQRALASVTPTSTLQVWPWRISSWAYHLEVVNPDGKRIFGNFSGEEIGQLMGGN